LPSTRDTADPRRDRITAEPPPLIPATRADFLALLANLNPEELSRYGQIAYDQYVRETRFRVAQILMLLAAVGTALGVTRGLILSGYSRMGVLALGLSALLGYWPYRSAKIRRLWWSHYEAVKDEQKRRAIRTD
jgi:hypothetical protein